MKPEEVAQQLSEWVVGDPEFNPNSDGNEEENTEDAPDEDKFSRLDTERRPTEEIGNQSVALLQVYNATSGACCCNVSCFTTTEPKARYS